MKNEGSLSRPCPSFDVFLEEKAGFEKLHSRSLESCSQVLVGTLVESLRLPAFAANTTMSVCILDWSGKAAITASQSHRSGESLDPLDHSRRLAVEMCESLLEDIVPFCSSSPQEAELVDKTTEPVPSSSWHLCTETGTPGYDLSDLSLGFDAFAPYSKEHWPWEPQEAYYIEAPAAPSPYHSWSPSIAGFYMDVGPPNMWGTI